MKTFRLRCKKTLCSGINDRDSIWILICNTKDCTSGQYKVLDQSQQTGQCSNRIPVKEWNIQTDQSIPGILWRCQYTSRYILYTSQVPLADTKWDQVMGSTVQEFMEESYSIPCGIMKRILQHSLRFSLINLDRLHLMDVSVYQ